MQYAQLPGSDQELLNAVTDVTGANPEFVMDEQFATTILPTLRSLRAMAEYACRPGAAVTCPVYAYLGDSDETTNYEDVLAWSQHTTSGFAVRTFPGRHFYLTANLPDFVADIELKVSHLARDE
jgi:surfactin synthase thioesterase subunit